MSDSWVDSVVKKHQKDDSALQLVNTEYDTATPTGENYSSNITRAKMTLLTGDKNKLVKSFIIKEDMTPDNPELQSREIFKVEIKVYSDIIPKMEALMSEFKDDHEKLWGQIVHFTPNRKMVFEDLKEDNYKVMTRQDGLKLEDACFVLKSLARFHGMSKILMERKTLQKTDFSPHYASADSPVVKNLFEGGLKQLSTSMLELWPQEWKPVAEKINEEVNHVLVKLKDLVHSECDEQFIALNHGDMWVCNLMFKYGTDGKPTSLRIVDYQVAHVNSLAWDLIHLMYSSLKPKLRNENFDVLLTSYHESLTSTLKFYRYSKEIPSLESLKKEMKRLNYYAFVQTAILYPLTVADTNEAIDINKVRADTTGVEKPFNPAVMNAAKLVETVGAELKKFCEEF